jgi:CRISPR-associated protein Cmr5
MQSREQRYAKMVYEQVSEYPGKFQKDSTQRKEYGSMAHKLPVLVRTAGLAQALAFVDSRSKKEPYEKLLDHLAVTVGEQDRDSLLKHSREADLSEYMYLTEQVLLALKWYKRFAQSILEVDPTVEAQGGGND